MAENITEIEQVENQNSNNTESTLSMKQMYNQIMSLLIK